MRTSSDGGRQGCFMAPRELFGAVEGTLDDIVVRCGVVAQRPEARLQANARPLVHKLARGRADSSSISWSIRRRTSVRQPSPAAVEVVNQERRQLPGGVAYDALGVDGEPAALRGEDVVEVEVAVQQHVWRGLLQQLGGLAQGLRRPRAASAYAAARRPAEFASVTQASIRRRAGFVDGRLPEPAHDLGRHVHRGASRHSSADSDCPGSRRSSRSAPFETSASRRRTAARPS